MPAIVFTVVFAVCGFSPFGGKDIFFSDMGDQYYPFISDYLHRIKEGRSLFWSWSLGGGVDYLTVFTYYLSSPLNLLLLLVPESVLPEALTFLIVFKIGLAGLFMGIFLNNGIKKGFSVPLFATFYALSSFAVLYYWNIIWLDAFALLPLVILGETVLFHEGKFKLYIVTLSLSIITNFYMGFYACVFVGITFFAQCYIQKLTLKEFKQKLALIAISSAVAIGITAFLTLPAYIYLTVMGPVSKYGFPTAITFTHSFRDIIGNVLAFSQNVTDMHYYMPNIYCGILCLILTVPYLGSTKIERREKVTFVVIILFMILSFNTNVLDYMLNAFRYSNGLPFRYMHLLFFTLTATAYRGFTVISENGVKRRDLLLTAVAAFVVLWAATGTIQAAVVLPNAAFMAGYILIFAILGAAHNLKNDKTRVILKHICLAAMIMAGLSEAGINAYKTINTENISQKNNYFDNYAQTKALLDTLDTSSSDFYRVETTAQYEEDYVRYLRQFNDSALFGYNGLSLYSSTIAEGAAELYKDIALPVISAITYSYSSYGYSLSSPVANLFLNLRYIISGNNNTLTNGGIFWEIKSETEEGLTLLENKKHLPLGFMVNESILNYTPDTVNPFISNPFVAQNNLFSLATGLDDNLFTFIPPANVTSAGYTVERDDTVGGYIFSLEAGADSGSITFEYEMPKDDMLYIYLTNSAHATLERPDDASQYELANRFSYIIPAGYFAKGETVRLNAAMTAYTDNVNFRPLKQGGALVYAAVMDEELFNAGYNILTDETLRLTEFRDTYIRGEITVTADGLLYTSIPLSDNWTAYVDGKKTEIKPIGGAFAGVLLTTGEHTIEFRYFNKPFVIGVLISLISLGAFVVMWRGLPKRSKH